MNEKWVVAARQDGFGQRLCAILVGLYLAKKLNFNFGFVWGHLSMTNLDLSSKKDKDRNFLGVAMDEAEVVFSEDFIKNYLLNPKIDSWVDSDSGGSTIKVKNFRQLAQKSNFDKKWGYYACPSLPSDFIADCDRKECLQELGNIYKSISFSKEFTEIQENVANITSNNNFIALHIRGGGSSILSY